MKRWELSILFPLKTRTKRKKEVITMKNNELIQKLKEFKNENQISIDKLAALLNVSKSLIYIWFNGYSQPSRRNANKIKLLINQHLIVSNEIKEGSYIQCEFMGFKNVCGTIRKLMNNSCIVNFDEDHLGTMPHLMYEQLNACGVVNYRKAKPLEGNI